jgi:hypothetical protein
MTATPDRHDGESFRVSHYGFHVGYACSVPELERWLTLADLEEALRQRARRNLSVAAGSCRSSSSQLPPLRRVPAPIGRPPTHR